MKKTVTSLVICLALLFVTSTAMAGTSDTQDVTYSVSAINEISASGNPAALNITTTTAGSDPSEVTDATTTYSVSTNETNRKITAVLDFAVTGGTLKINMTAPASGVSAGDVTLTAVTADAVTSIDTEASAANTITYKYSATMADGVIASDTVQVTLTITAG